MGVGLGRRALYGITEKCSIGDDSDRPKDERAPIMCLQFLSSVFLAFPALGCFNRLLAFNLGRLFV